MTSGLSTLHEKAANPVLLLGADFDNLPTRFNFGVADQAKSFGLGMCIPESL